MTGVTRDLRLQTVSGDITVDGGPPRQTLGIFTRVQAMSSCMFRFTASYQLSARSRSGNIDAAIPVVREGPSGKHEWQGRIGASKARVEIDACSGDISLH